MTRVNELKQSLTIRLMIFASLTIVLTAGSALAQNGNAPAVNSFNGKYEGTVKHADGSTLPVVFDLKNEGGKVSGNVVAQQTTIAISEGSLVDSKLTLKLVGHPGVFTAKVEGDKINGEWTEGTDKRVVELKKVVANTATAETFDLNGQWDAVADAQGQNFPFTLTLKLDGDKVSGSSSSQLGDSTISNGAFKDGVLSFQIDGQSGTVMMSAKVVEGKLAGEFDFAGQMQGKWVAVKKK